MSFGPLSRTDLERLFAELDAELGAAGVSGELYLVGGAVMCLVHEARASTRDVDGYFKPTKEMRIAAAKLASRHDLPANWLNDAVKGYLSERGTFNVFLELGHLKIFAADAAYLLAMKCLSARIGEEFHDLDDIRYLLRFLNITAAAEARSVIERYYPLERFPQKTLYLLDELLAPNLTP